MNAELYRKCVRPAKESPDGKSPTLIVATEENNGYAVFRSSYEGGTELLLWTLDRNAAIERAVKQES